MLLAIGGTALVTLLGQTARSIESLRMAELETRAASAELSTLAVLGNEQLTSRLGRTHSRGWSLVITRTSANLFDVSIAASDTGKVLLHTTLYRPDTATSVQ